MNILDVMDAITPGGISAADMAVAAGIDMAAMQKMLEELAGNGIGRRAGDAFEFSAGDRLKAAILALGGGAGMDEVAQRLGWKDFEGLVAEILNAANFEVVRNLVLKKPRMEIDVAGTRLGVSMLIDCKHWKRIGAPAMRRIAARQAGRARHYVDSAYGETAIPVIVTLYQDETGMVDGIPVVPITHFASFVDGFYGNMDGMAVIRKG